MDGRNISNLASQDVECRQVTKTYPGANGLAVWEDRMFVGDSKNATVTIYQLRPDKGADILSQVVSVSIMGHNVQAGPTSNTLHSLGAGSCRRQHKHRPNDRRLDNIKYGILLIPFLCKH